MNQAFYILHLFYSNSKLLQSTIDAKVKKTLRVWKWYRATYYFGNFTKSDDAAAVWRELDL